LPLMASSVSEPERPSSKVHDMPALKVLIADDNAVNRMVLSRLLEKHRHEVISVINGKEAVEFVAGHDVDVVLMDIQMPVLDGEAALAQIRQLDPVKKDVPVIAVTANVSKQESERLLAVGFDGYFGKPFDFDELLQSLHSAIRTKAA
jgi:CheY-like chemotaxis protein